MTFCNCEMKFLGNDSRNSMGYEQDHLASVLHTRRQLLIGEVAQCLSVCSLKLFLCCCCCCYIPYLNQMIYFGCIFLLQNISTVLVDHVNPTDQSFQRSLRQGRAVESEMLLNNLGNSLVELGQKHLCVLHLCLLLYFIAHLINLFMTK